jgi:ABC-2 type transport system ATP-binding protein
MERDTWGVALAAERIAQLHQQAERARLARHARRTGRRRDHSPAREPNKEAAMAVERGSSWQAAPEPRPALAVEASGLVKTFGIDLAVPTGSVYGFLGPNGAGKTTTLRMLATLLRPDAGHARVLGHDIVRQADAVRSQVSLTGQYASVDEDLTGRENLLLLARLLGYRRAAAKRRAAELLDAFDLTQASGRLVNTYSGGMRRRLDIAASIVVTPQVLFLDEPTTGLDPRSRNQLWELIRTLAAGGTTVLLTTQYLDEADQLADRIAVIDHGRLIAEGTPGQLKASIGAGTLRVRLRDPGQRSKAQHTLSQALEVPVHPDADPEALSARVADSQRAAHALGELSGAGVAVSDFALGQPSLDEVFLALTGRPAQHADATTQEDAA